MNVVNCVRSDNNQSLTCLTNNNEISSPIRSVLTIVMNCKWRLPQTDRNEMFNSFDNFLFSTDLWEREMLVIFHSLFKFKFRI